MHFSPSTASRRSTSKSTPRKRIVGSVRKPKPSQLQEIVEGFQAKGGDRISENNQLAIHALQWATTVSAGNADELAKLDLAPTPEKPSPAQWRALPIEVVRTHLDRLMLGRNTQEGLDALLEIGLLDVWMPEVAAMVGFGDGEWRHKDVWKHTKQVVWQSVPRIEVRWGALFHDIGKMRTRKIDPQGNVTFRGHAEVGAAMFKKRIAQRLGFEGALSERIHFLIYHHLRASQYDGSWTDAAIRRFNKEMGEGLTDLLDLSRADITTKRPEKRKRGLRMISELAAEIRAIEAEDNKPPMLPSGLGDAIMTAFGIPPSRRIGELRETLLCGIEEGKLQPQQNCDYYVSWIRAQALVES